MWESHMVRSADRRATFKRIQMPEDTAEPTQFPKKGHGQGGSRGRWNNGFKGWAGHEGYGGQGPCRGFGLTVFLYQGYALLSVQRLPL